MLHTRHDHAVAVVADRYLASGRLLIFGKSLQSVSTDLIIVEKSLSIRGPHNPRQSRCWICKPVVEPIARDAMSGSVPHRLFRTCEVVRGVDEAKAKRKVALACSQSTRRGHRSRQVTMLPPTKIIAPTSETVRPNPAKMTVSKP